MKKLLALVFLVLPAVIIAVPDGAFDYYTANMTLLEAKTVQKELNITAQQRNRMNAFADADRPKRTAIIQQFQKEAAEAQKNHKTYHADYNKIRPLDQELKKNVFSVLSAAQLKRLREITLQSGGLAALLDERVAQECGVSSGAVTKLRTIFGDASREANDVRTRVQQKIFAEYSKIKPKDEADAKRLQQEAFAKFSKEAGPQLQAIQQRTKSKMEALLTAANKAKFKELQGKPFKPS